MLLMVIQFGFGILFQEKPNIKQKKDWPYVIVVSITIMEYVKYVVVY